MNEKQLQNEQGRGWREMSEATEEIGAGGEDLIGLLSGEQIGWFWQ